MSHTHKQFTIKGSLNIHMTSHSGKKCSICGSAFSIKVYLKGHMKIHTGEKPYACSNCDRWFGYKCQLKYHIRHHMRIHTDEKLYTCSICGRGFIKKFNLKNPAPYIMRGSKIWGPLIGHQNKCPPLWIGENKMPSHPLKPPDPQAVNSEPGNDQWSSPKTP